MRTFKAGSRPAGLSWRRTFGLVLTVTTASGLPAWGQATLPSLSPTQSSPAPSTPVKPPAAGPVAPILSPNPTVTTPSTTRTPSATPVVPSTFGSPVTSTSGSLTTCDATQLPPVTARRPAPGPLPTFAAPSTALTAPKSPAEVTIAETTPLTLAQTIELARTRNRNLQIAALQVTQQREVLRQVRASLYPTASVQGGITRSDSAQTAIAAKRIGVARPAPTHNLNGSLNLNYDAFTSGQRPASIRAAEAAVRSSEQAYLTQFQQIQLDAANAYYDLQQAGDLIRIARQSVTSATENLRVTQATEAAGIGTRFDVLQAQVSLANFKQQLTQAISQQQIAQRNIAQLLSLPQMTNVTAADAVAIEGEWSPTLESSILTALQNRSELSQVLQQRLIAQENRRVALGSLGPQVALSTNINFADSLDDSQTGSLGYGLGGQVSKTIFDGGLAKAVAAQQQTNANIAETQFTSFKNLIRFQIEQNYYTLRSSREQILTTRCAIEQARQGLQLAQLRQQYGVGTSLDVSNAETARAQAENNYLQAVVSYNRALSSLRRFVGDLRRQSS